MVDTVCGYQCFHGYCCRDSLAAPGRPSKSNLAVSSAKSSTGGSWIKSKPVTTRISRGIDGPKRQAEELPTWNPESKEASTPWRKPRHHVYGYRQRDYAAEAEILKEQEDLANRGEPRVFRDQEWLQMNLDGPNFSAIVNKGHPGSTLVKILVEIGVIN